MLKTFITNFVANYNDHPDYLLDDLWTAVQNNDDFEDVTFDEFLSQLT